ncbi:hypothetical protein [Flagellimonas meridianipacifica]|uniref:Ubiquinone biosynthesis protein COQ4 n=1 Tax=Flagellimonas meridianipacifica TaxID=1080225 RepID=A0A2T0M8R5_9FLAO|nr:hypothetical protein [Allomuricauda pacifica]PRX53863.1 hypothetical protein CLV81_2253 [Allomuricauda pacifica]
MRAVILEHLYEWSKKPYQKFLKKNCAWNISVTELVHYPEHSLGFHLGAFLLKHRFEIQPKLENHDVFHVLTNTGISVPEEISMQYYLLGNGKKSLYLFTVIGIGTFLYPDCYQLFKKAYQKGKSAYRFHHLDFSKMLEQPLGKIQSAFLIQ